MCFFLDFALDANQCKVFVLQALPIHIISLSVLFCSVLSATESELNITAKTKIESITSQENWSEEKKKNTSSFKFICYFIDRLTQKPDTQQNRMKKIKKPNPKLESTHLFGWFQFESCCGYRVWAFLWFYLAWAYRSILCYHLTSIQMNWTRLKHKVHTRCQMDACAHDFRTVNAAVLWHCARFVWNSYETCYYGLDEQQKHGWTTNRKLRKKTPRTEPKVDTIQI